MLDMQKEMFNIICFGVFMMFLGGFYFVLIGGAGTADSMFVWLGITLMLGSFIAYGFVTSRYSNEDQDQIEN